MPSRVRKDSTIDETATTQDDTGDDTSGSGEESVEDSTGTRYLNVSGSPITYTREGRQVAAGEWTPETHLDAIGQAARRNGYLLPPSAL